MTNLRPATLAVQSGMYGHIVPPIDISKTSPWGLLEVPHGHTYSRTNPDSTVRALEEVFSGMHGGAEAIVTNSGQGATVDILNTVNRGEHIIAGKQIYGGTRRYIEEYFSKWASFTLLDPRDIRQLEDAVRENTRYLLIETPTNPLLDIVDLEQVQKFSERNGIPYVLDNTFATMKLLDGFRFGAHIIYYSASKYLGGHHNAIGGVVVTRDRPLAEEIRQNRRNIGNAISPYTASDIHRGLATLELRMRQHCENAQIIAEYLAQHPMVSQVYYPGLPSHTGHETAKSQMSGFGGVVSFKVNADPKELARDLAKDIAEQEPPVIRLSESLGSVISLLAHPATMSHRHMTSEQMEEIGINNNLFRLSVGIEDVRDIQESLEHALNAAKNSPLK